MWHFKGRLCGKREQYLHLHYNEIEHECRAIWGKNQARSQGGSAQGVFVPCFVHVPHILRVLFSLYVYIITSPMISINKRNTFGFCEANHA